MDVNAVGDKIANAFSRLQETSRSRVGAADSNYSTSPKSRNKGAGMVSKTNTADLVQGLRTLDHIDQSVQ